MRHDFDSEHRAGDWDTPVDLPPVVVEPLVADPTLTDYIAQVEVLVDEGLYTAATVQANKALRLVENPGDVKALLAAVEPAGIELLSRRTAYGSHRALYAFSGRPVLDGRGWRFTDDPTSTRLHYLYNDAVNHGSCEAANLWKVARF